MSKWIEFIDGPPAPSTNRWFIRTIEGGHVLGTVAWFGRWRRYAFFPGPETVYEQQCLRDIAAFCEEQTKMHRERRKRKEYGL